MLRSADDAPRWAPRRPRRAAAVLAAATLAGSLVAACSAPEPTVAPTTPAVTETPQTPIAVSALPMATDLRPANVEDPYTQRVLGLLLRTLACLCGIPLVCQTVLGLRHVARSGH